MIGSTCSVPLLCYSTSGSELRPKGILLRSSCRYLSVIGYLDSIRICNYICIGAPLPLPHANQIFGGYGFQGMIFTPKFIPVRSPPKTRADVENHATPRILTLFIISWLLDARFPTLRYFLRYAQGCPSIFVGRTWVLQVFNLVPLSNTIKPVTDSYRLEVPLVTYKHFRLAIFRHDPLQAMVCMGRGVARLHWHVQRHPIRVLVDNRVPTYLGR